MSPKQFIIIGVSAAAAAAAAAAALLSNSPVVTAIGSVAQHNTPTDGYPPLHNTTEFDAFVNSTLCRYGNRFGPKPDEEHLSIFVNENGMQSFEVACPREDGDLPAFHVQWRSYGTSSLDRYRRLDGKPLEESIFEFIAPGRSLAVDPLSLVKVGSLQDDLQQLTSAAGEVSYPSFYHDLPWSPEWYEEETFDYDDYLVTDRVLSVSDGEESDDEATRVAVERLQKVCLSAKDVIKTYFGDFKDLCALYRGVAEGALISAESRGWKFERTKGSRCDVRRV